MKKSSNGYHPPTSNFRHAVRHAAKDGAND